MTEKIEDGGWMLSAWPGLAGLPSDDAHDQATPQLKAYCSSCGISPASFRACIEHGTGKPYEDLCCDNCDSVIASVEGRTQAPQWLPAESAPMDGTEFLSLNTNQGNLRAVTWYSKAHGYFCATGGQHLYQFTHWLAIESAVLAKIVATPAASPTPTERFFAPEFEVWQNDEMVASASGPRETAYAEAMRYAAQYEQDGPVRVFEVVRVLFGVSPVAPVQVKGEA